MTPPRVPEYAKWLFVFVVAVIILAVWVLVGAK